MALIKCPNCQKLTSDSEGACPHCGTSFATIAQGGAASWANQTPNVAPAYTQPHTTPDTLSAPQSSINNFAKTEKPTFQYWTAAIMLLAFVLICHIEKIACFFSIKQAYALSELENSSDIINSIIFHSICSILTITIFIFLCKGTQAHLKICLRLFAVFELLGGTFQSFILLSYNRIPAKINSIIESQYFQSRDLLNALLIIFTLVSICLILVSLILLLRYASAKTNAKTVIIVYLIQAAVILGMYIYVIVMLYFSRSSDYYYAHYYYDLYTNCVNLFKNCFLFDFINIAAIISIIKASGIQKLPKIQKI